MKFSRASLLASALMGLVFTGSVHADGMQPSSALVILYEEEGEATMSVKNTDANAALLHTTILDIPEDTESKVLVTPPVARVEGGEEQLVRFIYQGPPLQTQRLKRVIFDGIGPSNHIPGRATARVSVRQNLPVLLHPKGLARNAQPWTLLQWSAEGDQLTVRNDSPYVVRLVPEVTLLPANTVGDIGRTYLLPGQGASVTVAGAAGAAEVRFQPATVYGFSTAPYVAPVAVTPQGVN